MKYLLICAALTAISLTLGVYTATTGHWFIAALSFFSLSLSVTGLGMTAAKEDPYRRVA
jgi:hypothetical protein